MHCGLHLVCLTKSFMYLKKRSVSIQPLSETLPIVPGGARSTSSRFIRFRLKIMSGGTKVPVVLIAQITVVVCPRSPLITDASTHFPLGAITFTGLCTQAMPVSSQLKIWWGSKLFDSKSCSKFADYLYTEALFNPETLFRAIASGFLRDKVFCFFKKPSTKSLPAIFFSLFKGWLSFCFSLQTQTQGGVSH